MSMPLETFLQDYNLSFKKKRDILNRLEDETYFYFVEKHEDGLYLSRQGEQWLDYILCQKGTNFIRAEIAYFLSENALLEERIKKLAPESFIKSTNCHDAHWLASRLEISLEQAQKSLAELKRKSGNRHFLKSDPDSLSKSGFLSLVYQRYSTGFGYILRKEYHTYCYVLSVLERRQQET